MGKTEMTKEDWLNCAIKFHIGQIRDHVTVTIEARAQVGGLVKWAVCASPDVLCKDGKWHYEPLPSSRTIKFLQISRFDTRDEAYIAWKEYSGE